jgi:hypothetical protein
LPKTGLALAAALALAAPALAQEAGGEDPMKAIQEASVKVSKALKESEEALTKVARGETAAPKPVDIALPPAGSSSKPPESPPSGGT